MERGHFTARQNEMCACFDAMAQEMPLGELEIEGIRAWPLVAGYLLYKHAYGLEIFDPAYRAEPIPVVDNRALATAETDARQRIRELPSLHGTGCLAFMLSGESRLQRDGGRYHQMLDPLWESISEREPGMIIEATWGWGASPESAAENAPKPRHLPTYPIESHPFVMQAARRASDWPRSSLLSRPTRWLRAHNLTAHEDVQVLEAREVAMFLGMFTLCRVVLQRVRPRCIAVCGFNGYHAAGMTAAARSLSIPVIDHIDAPRSPTEAPYFRHLTARDRQRLHVFPDAIWVHDPPSKFIMMERHAFRDDEVFVGNCWRERCLRSAHDVVRQLPRVRHRVLVCLWPGSLVPKALLQAMALAPDDVLWLLRLHPSHVHERSARNWEPGPEEGRTAALWAQSKILGDSPILDQPVSNEQLERHGVRHFEFVQSSTLPLYCLLPHVTHHVTAHSTTAVDARDFGIATTFVDRHGIEYFPSLVEEGMARLCLEPLEILKHVAESLRANPKPCFRGDGSPPLDSEISRLLEAAGAPSPGQAIDRSAWNSEAPLPAAEIRRPTAGRGRDSNRADGGLIGQPISSNLNQPSQSSAQAAPPPNSKRMPPIRLLTIRCQACGSDDSLKIRNLPQEDSERNLRLGLVGQSKWNICRKCGFVFQNPRLSEQDQEAAYTRSLYRAAEGTPLVIDDGYKAFAPWQLRRFEPYLNSLGINLKERPLTNCLDYGCGIGGALEYLVAPGRRMWGIELDEGLSKYGNEHFHIDIRNRLEQLPEEVNYDLIFTHNALEHVYDPNNFFRFCKRHLKRKAGLLIIAVPSWRNGNTHHILAEFNAWHNSMFDHVSLAHFLNRHGFFLMAHRYQNIAPDGSYEICAIACKSDRPNHFLFSADEIRREIEEVIAQRDEARRPGPLRTESIIDVVS